MAQSRMKSRKKATHLKSGCTQGKMIADHRSAASSACEPVQTNNLQNILPLKIGGNGNEQYKLN